MSMTAQLLAWQLVWANNPLTEFSYDACMYEARKLAVRLIAGDY